MLDSSTKDNRHPSAPLTSLTTIFLAFLRLGLTSFGGPIAHIAYFRDEFVGRRKWIDEGAYADLVALCQFLPGPTSSQVGLGVGLARGGLLGALVAWIGFTMPSAISLILFGYGVIAYQDVINPGALHGLKVVAVAVVAQAVWVMARNLCPDAKRATIAIASACFVVASPTAFSQVGVIVTGGLAGLLFLRSKQPAKVNPLGIRVNHNLAIASLLLFFVGLIGLPILATAYDSHLLALIESFYSSGSLVFGGGHVVLPLLQYEVVPPGWIPNDMFLAGYGAAQAVPGPLFAFAAYLGTVLEMELNGWIGGLICLIAIFVPSFLLVIGVLPFWDSLRQASNMQTALLRINAAVVGLLLAALYQPVWISAILSPLDFCLALIAYLLLVFWKIPPWLVVIFSGVGGWATETIIKAL